MFGPSVGVPVGPAVLHGGHFYALDVGLGIALGVGVVLAFLLMLRWLSRGRTDGRRSENRSGQ